MQNSLGKDSISQANFEKNPRRKQELSMRPYADELYHQVFGRDIAITRYEHSEKEVLDIHFAIDVEIVFSNGLIITGQEKFLSQKYACYNSITIEYMQNKEDPSDWFKLASLFYMTGYINPEANGFNPWLIANWLEVVLSTLRGEIPWHLNENKNGRAQASFKYFDMRALPPNCIIASSFKV